jgi:hypothetical protein
MSQLLSGKTKGRFGAPPESGGETSPWRVVPLYFLVPLTAIFLAVTVPAWIGYQACGERHESVCMSGGALRNAETGTMSGIVLATGVALGAGILLVLLATLLVRKWPRTVVYSMALIGFVLVVYTFLAFNGSMPTPGGTLGELPPPP